jgi:hypothetical protein
MLNDTHTSMDTRVMKWAAFVLAAFVSFAFVRLAVPTPHHPAAATAVGHPAKTG